MLQVFCTDSCILIRQIQLFALGFTKQGIGHYVQQALPVQYHDGQLIHPLKPTCQHLLRYSYINICYHGLWSLYKVVGTPSM